MNLATVHPIIVLRNYALAYAKRGWPVFPLHNPVDGGCSCGNPNCGNVGKHPRTRHGLKDATTDEDQIRTWWAKWPDANIALCTGSVSGIVAVDVDPRSSGDETWKWLCEEHDPPATVRSNTGRGDGGFHLFFAYTDKLKGRTDALGKGVDVKAEGGYVCAPPSLHEAGGRYEFADGLGPKQIGIAPLPEWCKPTASKPKKSARIQQTNARTDGDGWLYTAFNAAGWLNGLTQTGFQQVICPWESEHTSSTPSSTVIYAPSAGRAMGFFECKHSHCQGRTLEDVKKALPTHAVETADRAYPPVSQRQAFESRANSGDSGESRARSKLVIEVTNDREEVVNMALEAISGHPNIYQRKGSLVQVLYDVQTSNSKKVGRLAGAPRIRNIPTAWLHEKMGSAAAWVKNTKKGMMDTFPPDWVPNFALAREGWPQFEPLINIAEAPIMRADGTIIEEPGYDSDTGVLYAPNTEYPKVPMVPTRVQALGSLNRILDLVVDFPFATPAHKSGWLAALLTPFSRSAFHGPAPFFLVDANNKGTGKGKLVDIIAKICTGRDFARCPQTDDPEEERKRILTMAIEGDSMVLYDDITKLGGKALDAALTSVTWKDRVLGSNVSSGELPITFNWYGTGNNVTIREDVSRRLLHIRLDTQLERPEERKGFRHPDLLAYVEANRASLAVDCLTMLRAYVVDGKPLADLPPWGSFEQWSNLIRGCIVWLGLDDPGSTRQALRETADVTTEAIGGFLRGWKFAARGNCLSSGEMAGLLRDADSRAYQELRNAITELRTTKHQGTLPNASEIGAILRKVRGRMVESLRIDCKKTDKGNMWVVSEIEADT